MLEKLKTETFGNYISRLRKAKGYSQRKLAQVTGISNTTISRIEKDQTTNPDLNTLKLLANYLNVDEMYMLEASGYSLKNNKSIHEELTERDKKDIAKDIENIMANLEESDGITFYNEPLDELDKELLKNALNHALENIKIKNKEKYTPKKYKNKNK